jgi:murein DD-endopeptidase MepM/ murein hydrolase activator NlpD
MKFYTYEKENLSFQSFKIFTFKRFIYLLLIEIIISFALIFIISNFYNTPKEKKLKGEISYLVREFDELNQRMIESDMILEKIIQKDSIIYRSIFNIDDINSKKLESYYDSESDNNYSEIVEETHEKLLILKSKLDKEAFMMKELVKEAYSHQEMLNRIPAIQPIDNKDLRRTASGWGYRIHPIYKIRKFHYGIDFTARIGTPIYSTGQGKIEYLIPHHSKSSKGYGNLIIIDHGYGYKTLYAHLSKFNVKKGQKVKRGDVIGYVGSTGLSTGPHLHYEVIKNGRKVNPIHYFFNDLSPEEYQEIIKISSSIQKSYD